jgi:hypothetical protein
MNIVHPRRHRRPSISPRAIERRVSLRLVPDGLVLRKCSPRSRWHTSLGDHYLTRAVDGFVVATHQDLKQLARDVSALSPAEVIVHE